MRLIDMIGQKKSILVAAILLTSVALTSIYFLNYKQKEVAIKMDTKAQITEKMQKLLEEDDTLAFIVTCGSVEMLMDYYYERFEETGTVGIPDEVLEKLMNECMRNSRSPEERRIEACKRKRAALEEYERSKENRNRSEAKEANKSVQLNVKNVRFEKDKELKEVKFDRVYT